MVPKKVGPCFAEIFDKTDINPYLIGDRGMGKTLFSRYWYKVFYIK